MGEHTRHTHNLLPMHQPTNWADVRIPISKTEENPESNRIPAITHILLSFCGNSRSIVWKLAKLPTYPRRKSNRSYLWLCLLEGPITLVSNWVRDITVCLLWGTWSSRTVANIFCFSSIRPCNSWTVSEHAPTRTHRHQANPQKDLVQPLMYFPRQLESAVQFYQEPS